MVYHYDDAGNLTQADGPSGVRRYGLVGDGRVASITDADGVVEVLNDYDDAGRVIA